MGNKALYRPGFGGDKAVSIHAAQLPGECRREAAKVDQELGFLNGDGPSLWKLQRYPPVMDLCFGAYGECSGGGLARADGSVSPQKPSGSLEAAKELSLVTGYLRRRLSTATVRANVKCLFWLVRAVVKPTSASSG